jgi:hypothetical protein
MTTTEPKLDTPNPNGASMNNTTPIGPMAFLRNLFPNSRNKGTDEGNGTPRVHQVQKASSIYDFEREKAEELGLIDPDLATVRASQDEVGAAARIGQPRAYRPSKDASDALFHGELLRRFRERDVLEDQRIRAIETTKEAESALAAVPPASPAPSELGPLMVFLFAVVASGLSMSLAFYEEIFLVLLGGPQRALAYGLSLAGGVVVCGAVAAGFWVSRDDLGPGAGWRSAAWFALGILVSAALLGLRWGSAVESGTEIQAIGFSLMEVLSLAALKLVAMQHQANLRAHFQSAAPVAAAQSQLDAALDDFARIEAELENNQHVILEAAEVLEARSAGRYAAKQLAQAARSAALAGHLHGVGAARVKAQGGLDEIEEEDVVLPFRKH